MKQEMSKRRMLKKKFGLLGTPLKNLNPYIYYKSNQITFNNLDNKKKQ